MWETILKRNIPEKGTSVDDIIYLITQARQLPDLELKLIDTKGKAANEIRPIRNKMEDINSQIKGIKKEITEANKNKGGEGVESLEEKIEGLQELNIPLREEILKIERQLKKDLAKIQSALDNPVMKKNPFTPIITRRATYSENAKFSKKGIKFDESGNILDDGYGNEQFYGKATPLTLQEAAEHYKETVVDYDEVNVNRVMPKDKPYSGSYGSKPNKPKPEPSKEVRDLREAKERLSYYEDINEDRRTSADKAMILRLRSEIKELESQIIEDAEESARVEFEAAQQDLPTVKNLPQIRIILQPISTADFNDFVVSLDKYIDTGSAPIIDKYKKENPEKFAEIMDLVETSSSTTSADEDRYLDKLLMMVNKKSIDFNRSASNNRVSLQVTEKDGYRKETNRLILPVNEDLSNRFGEISQWLAKHYEPVPEVKDENLFIQKLVKGINETVDNKGGNNSIAYAIQHMINNNLADRFSNQIVVTGRYLDANTEQQKFREFIGTQARRNMKLLENVATFLHRGKQMSSFLTEDQMNQANEMLQQQVGSKAFGRYFLAEIPSAQLQKKPKSGLATRLGVTGRKKTGKGQTVIPKKFQGPSRQSKQGPENRPKQTKPTLYPKEPKFKVPVGTKLDYPKDYEPMRGNYSGELTENQKEVLADIRETYKLNIPPSAKTIEENKKKLEETRAEAEEMSPEEKESNFQEWADQLVEIALKNKGRVDYEPYSGKRRTLSLGRSVGPENNKKYELYTKDELREKILENVKGGSHPFSGLYLKSGAVSKADLSGLSTKERRKVKTMLQNAHPTEYFGEDYLRLGKVINIIDGLAEDEEAELLEKLGVKNLQMVKTAASLRKKYENLYKKLYDMVYDEEE
tara:strand:- start:3080 stop:5677 length:2598 start_codon:yes stop_codon:yes gene_type:complete